MPNLPDQAPNPSALPTRKWLAALVAGLGTIAVMYISTGSWDAEESTALVGLLVERSISYLTPNRPAVSKAKDYAQV